MRSVAGSAPNSSPRRMGTLEAPPATQGFPRPGVGRYPDTNALPKCAYPLRQARETAFA